MQFLKDILITYFLNIQEIIILNKSQHNCPIYFADNHLYLIFGTTVSKLLDPSNDYVTYAGLVNKECEKFQSKTLTDDQFTCLIFVCGLQSTTNAAIRTRIWAKIDSDAKLLSVSGRRMQENGFLKRNASMIEKGNVVFSISHINYKL